MTNPAPIADVAAQLAAFAHLAALAVSVPTALAAAFLLAMFVMLARCR